MAAPIHEAVVAFADKQQFRAAVRALLAAGFAPADLSVLASHDSAALRLLEEAGGRHAHLHERPAKP
jgi:hypothetical protein